MSLFQCLTNSTMKRYTIEQRVKIVDAKLHFVQFVIFLVSIINQMRKFLYIHTYIIGHYNPSVRIIFIVSHTPYVVCVNFIRKFLLEL